MLFCLAINRSWKQKIDKIYVLREEEEEEEEGEEEIATVLKPPLKAILEKYKNDYNSCLKLPV